MRLRKKLLVSVVIITVLTILSTSIIAQFILLDQIREYEKKTAGQELQGLVWVINDRIRSEEITAIDWSNWDATYDFIQNRDESYIDSVLVDETYITGGLNVMIYVNESGDIIYERGFDTEEEKDMEIPAAFYQSLINHGILYNDTKDFESSAGILVLDDSVMLVSAYTILTSTGEGPVKGILIRSRYIDPGKMAKELGSNVDSFTIGGIPRNGDGYDYFTEEGEIIYHIDEGSCLGDWGCINAVTTIDDFYGDPLALEINMDRDIYTQGISTLFFIVTAIIIIGIISAGIYMIVFRSSVILQLDTLGKDAGEIAESKDLARRVDFEGDPEFMQLADSINKMLSSLEKATNEKMESERKYGELFSSSLDGIVLTDINGKIIDANPAFLDTTGISPDSDDENTRDLSFYSMIGKKCDPETISKMTDQWEKKKNSLKFEAELAVKENGYLPVELTSWPLIDEYNAVRAIWWLVRDIREKKEIERIRNEALSNIEENLEKMAILNDEIRNPLSIIVGLADMKCEEASEEIIEQVEKIDHIINLLDRGWLSSKKVHEFLRKQYLLEEDKKSGSDRDD